MYTTLSTIGLDPQSGLLYQLCLRSSPVACDLHRKLVEVRWCYESKSSQERQQKLVNFMFFWQKIGSKEFLDRQRKSKQYIPKIQQHLKFWKGNKTHLEFHSIPGSLGFLTFKTPRSTRAGDCENGWSHSSRLGIFGVKLLSIATLKISVAVLVQELLWTERPNISRPLGPEVLASEPTQMCFFV